MSSNDLSGWDFSGQNLANADLAASTLTNANLSGADTRGANFAGATLTGANTSNLIQSNGHIAGLDLTAGASLVVRDYDGNPAASPPTGPLPIVVDQHLAMDATGTLRLVFDADPWDSTISFSPGIPVTLGGTLELTFADGVDVATQIGRTIDLFDWTGVTPTGAFTVSSPYTWNLSKLYTTGEVTLSIPLAGDFNGNGTVDAADYTVWRNGLGSTYTPAHYDVWKANFGRTLNSPPLAGDYSGNGTVGPEDYDVWKANYGSSNSAADGNGDGTVNAADYTVWRDHLGQSAGSGAGAITNTCRSRAGNAGPAARRHGGGVDAALVSCELLKPL